MISSQEMKNKIVGLGVLATISAMGYYGCFAPRTLENSIVEEIGTYHIYDALGNPFLESDNKYIKVNTHYHCLDLGKYHNLSFTNGDKISVLKYIPKLQCDEVIKLVRE